MKEVSRIEELEIQKLKEEIKYFKEKYVYKRCYSNECTLSLNKETRKLTISPTNRKIGLLDSIPLVKVLKKNDINPDEVKSITVEKGVIAPSNSSDLFSFFHYCETMDLKNFDTSQVTDMNWMFYKCSSLTTLDLSNFDTSQVEDMDSMFANCSKLTDLDVSKFDTSQVTNMNTMFSGCSSLTTLDVSNFDTSQVTNMSFMFNNCSKLTALNLSKFDTSQVTDMSLMFYKCSKLKTVNFGDNCINLMSEVPEFSKIRITLNDKPII